MPSAASPARRVALALVLSTILTGLALLVGAPARATGPLVIATGTAAQQPDGTASLSWVTSGADPLLRGFRIDRQDLNTGVSTTLTTTSAVTSTVTDPLTNVATGAHSFAYTIRTVGARQPASFLINGLPQFYRTVPSGPAEVGFRADGPQVTLDWTGASVNAAQLTGYRVERRSGPTGPYQVIVPETTSNTLIDRFSGLSPGTHEVDYQITSLAGTTLGGVNSFPVQLFVEVPGFPADGTVRNGVAGDAAQLSWEIPAQNPDLVTGYRITRVVKQGPPSTIGTVGPGVRRFADPGLADIPGGAQVNYTVTALSTRGPGGSLPLFLTVDHRARPEPAGSLPETGDDVTTAGTAGVAAVTGGGLLVLVARRRRLRFVPATDR